MSYLILINIKMYKFVWLFLFMILTTYNLIQLNTFNEYTK